MANFENVLDVESLINPDHLAVYISEKWRDWNNHRSAWIEEKKELRNYLFATDTRTTSNSQLEWSNSTTTPKITQIRDNLHANYMATLFPKSRWLTWEATESDPKLDYKRIVTEGYMYDKIRRSDFEIQVSKLLSDWIDYGNCFATVVFKRDYTVLEDGEVIPGYAGPVVKRISPYDIAFDPTAPSFETTHKIVKTIVDLGSIKKAINDDPENAHLAKVFEDMVSVRNIVRSTDAEIHKGEGYIADGFSNLTMYYETDYVELLTFYGSIYNQETGELSENRIVTVADRGHVISDVEQPSWIGTDNLFHVGWRDRPDNLYAMGPLDNLVGLQYRIDHLENMKADVWDQIAYPVRKIRGEVDDFEWYPGCEIYVGDDGDVDYLVPDATAMNADTQIERLMFYMEEMAGAPKQAMGFRTPGEKTAFEVSSLENAANRIFNHKTAHFERVFLEPILNAMLEVGRRNLTTSDEIFIEDTDNMGFFETITKSDLSGAGKIIPMGARSFAEKSTRIQNLSNLIQLKVTDPSIGVHISGKQIAMMLAEELGERDLFGDNITVHESAETAGVQEEAEIGMEEKRQIAEERGI